MWRAFVLALCFSGLLCLAGCADEKVYDWQRPHDTYLVGSFSDSGKADALKSKLQRNGYACRIETDIKDGKFQLNVLVDVYDTTPDTMTKLESLAGTAPVPRKSTRSSAPATDAKAP